MRVPVAALLLAVSVCLAGCHGPGLSGAEGEVAFNRPSKHLGDAWVGLTLSTTVTVQNRGRSPLSVTWEVPEGFTVEGLTSPLPSGETDLTVTATRTAPGMSRGTLKAKAERSSSSIELTFLALAHPACNPATSCSSWAFDIHEGECVETVEPDGTQCDPKSQCVLEATCQAGQCVGAARECDDGDACTLNTCNALTGCEFPPAPPCPGDGACGVGVCDPAVGCTFEPAVDGTICGDVACNAAQVCIAGNCVVRDPPDGFVCKEASPCQGAGTCQNDTCVVPPPTTLSADWNYNVAPDPVLGAREKLHDYVLDADGRMAMTGFMQRLVVNAGTPAVKRLENTAARRCVLWNRRVTCADLWEYDIPGGLVNGTVAPLDAEGRPLWRFRLQAHRPAYVQETDTLFLARLVVMGPDRLAAIYEAYPRNSPNGTNCRMYYLAVLDAAGGLVSSSRIQDPFLTMCNHPHPYGAAADIAGNLYISFSPSSEGSAPLYAQSPSLLLSYDRNGTLRWKRTDVHPGGELAVVGNLLWSEGSTTPLNTATGVAIPAVGGLREQVGRAVVTIDRYVSSPWFSFAGATELHGYKHSSERAWTYSLTDPGDTFLTRELRLASWHPRAQAQRREAVLAFARLGGQQSLLAVDPSQGKELWRCAVDAPISTLPQLFDVAQDRLVMMADAEFGGDGDPPYANSHATFWRFPLTGVGHSRSPWPGTWGGPARDHLEKGALLPVTPGN